MGEIESMIIGAELLTEVEKAEKEAMDEYQLIDDSIDLIYY